MQGLSRPAEARAPASVVLGLRSVATGPAAPWLGCAALPHASAKRTVPTRPPRPPPIPSHPALVPERVLKVMPGSGAHFCLLNLHFCQPETSCPSRTTWPHLARFLCVSEVGLPTAPGSLMGRGSDIGY